VPYPATLVSGEFRSASKPRGNQKIPFLLTLSGKRESEKKNKRKKLKKPNPCVPSLLTLSFCPAGSSQPSKLILDTIFYGRVVKHFSWRKKNWPFLNIASWPV